MRRHGFSGEPSYEWPESDDDAAHAWGVKSAAPKKAKPKKKKKKKKPGAALEHGAPLAAFLGVAGRLRARGAENAASRVAAKLRFLFACCQRISGKEAEGKLEGKDLRLLGRVFGLAGYDDAVHRNSFVGGYTGRHGSHVDGCGVCALSTQVSSILICTCAAFCLPGSRATSRRSRTWKVARAAARPNTGATRSSKRPGNCFRTGARSTPTCSSRM